MKETNKPRIHTISGDASRRELRQFGLIMAAGLILIFGLFLPWIFDHQPPLWPWVAGLAFALSALIRPQALRPLHWTWMKFGHVVGWINTRIILAVLFYLIIVPSGLLMRLFGQDPMAKRRVASQTSYRVPSRTRDPKSLEKPF